MTTTNRGPVWNPGDGPVMYDDDGRTIGGGETRPDVDLDGARVRALLDAGVLQAVEVPAPAADDPKPKNRGGRAAAAATDETQEG